MNREKWHCEECGEQHTGMPAHVESVDGFDGTVELWFCAECSRHELSRGRFR